MLLLPPDWVTALCSAPEPTQKLYVGNSADAYLLICDYSSAQSLALTYVKFLGVMQSIDLEL